MTMKASTRQVSGITIVDMSGRITLGEGSVPPCQAFERLCHECAELRTALANRLLKVGLRKRRGHQRAHRQRSCRLSHDGDVVRVSTETYDVLDHPIQCGTLVHESIVARRVVGRLLH